jgi:Transposase
MSWGRRAARLSEPEQLPGLAAVLRPHCARSGRWATEAREGEAMGEPAAVVVGIDVAKAALDVAVRPSREQRQLSHDAVGWGELVAWLPVVQPQVIVLEATGGYEMPVVAAWGLAGLPVAVVNPRQVHDF